MLISYLIWNFVVGICMVPVFFIYVVNNEATIIIATILLFVLSLLLIVLSILYVVFHIVACVKYFWWKRICSAFINSFLQISCKASNITKGCNNNHLLTLTKYKINVVFMHNSSYITVRNLELLFITELFKVLYFIYETVTLHTVLIESDKV